MLFVWSGSRLTYLLSQAGDYRHDDPPNLNPRPLGRGAAVPWQDEGRIHHGHYGRIGHVLCSHRVVHEPQGPSTNTDLSYPKRRPGLNHVKGHRRVVVARSPPAGCSCCRPWETSKLHAGWL